MIAVAHLVVKDVRRREVAMQKTALMEPGGKAGKAVRDVALILHRSLAEAVQAVAVAGEQADVIGRGVPQAVAVTHQGHGLRTFKAALAQHHGTQERLLALRRFVNQLLYLAPEGGLGKTLHTERQALHLQRADGVATGMDFAALALKVLFQMRHVAAQMFIFGVKQDFHGILRSD